MKHLDKLIPMAMGLAMLTSCADNDMPFFAVTDPGTNAEYAYLNEYDVLKNYINPNANPNFKLGLGVDAGSFDAGNAQYQIAATNFNEVTPGNEMKYASIVGDDGSMNFSTVANMIEDAKAANLTIYGHTLAWHSQQNVNYLNGLIAGHAVDPGEASEVEDKYVDFSTLGSYNMWNGSPTSVTIAINDEGYLEIDNPEVVDPFYSVQYHIANGINWVSGQEYTITLMVRASSADAITLAAGTWSAAPNTKIGISTDWQEVEWTFTATGDGDGHIMLQSGNFAGTIEIQWVKLTHMEQAAGSFWENLVTNGDAEGEEVTSFNANEPGISGTHAAIIGAAGTGADGVGHAYVVKSADDPVNTYDTQFFVTASQAFNEGDKYRFTMSFKADKAAGSETQAHTAPGAYKHWQFLSSAPSFTTEWQTQTWEGTISAEQSGCNTIAFNLAVLGEANTYYFDDISFEIEGEGDRIPLTDEEKKDTLTWAMDQWITGIMNATGGYVTTWEAVNEAVGGADKDGDGWYELQTADPNNADDANSFYWQDYLTPEDYVPIVTKLATQRFEEAGGDPSQLKLFINDYNLEATWDNNKKLESLIHWISVWEAKGAKIDGIGTQMHVSYILNPTQQKAQEDAIVRMFQLMAATGKLVKISELDMGIVENQFEDAKKSEDVTYEEKLKMADFYKFIIEKYFEIIPQSQQYGITQWCCTYSPADSGWRPGEPCGLWDSNYNRTPMYGGFANGLAGKVIVEPSPVPGDGSDAGAVE